MDKVTWKPGTLLYPIPAVMVSCGTMDAPNVFSASWTGIVNSDPAMTYVSIRPERYSHGLIKKSREFVINLTTEALTRTMDYVGVKSGRDIDKFALPGITAVPATQLAAPMIAESPLNIECRVEQVTPLGSHDMFLAKIVAVNVDQKLLDAKGVLHLEKANLIVSNHGKYYTLAKQVGSFGYSVKKKTTTTKHQKRK